MDPRSLCRVGLMVVDIRYRHMYRHINKPTIFNYVTVTASKLCAWRQHNINLHTIIPYGMPSVIFIC